MKIPPKIYAKVFAELVKDKNPEKIEAMIKKFSALVAKNGDIASKEKIAALAERYLRETDGKHSFLIETARNLPEGSYAAILEKMGKGEYDVKKMVDENLIAGVKLTVDESRELDLSLRGILKNLFD